MFLRMTVMALGLGLTGQAAAGNKAPPLREICSQTTPTIRETWSKGVYDAAPAVATLMVEAIDGKLPEVRRQLRAMTPKDAQRWRQTAMLTAAWTGQSTVVDGLLADGAAVDEKGWIPPFKPGFFDQTVATMKHDPRFGGPAAVNRMANSGMVGNHAQTIGPALIVATECGDLATLDVLLRHHANVNPRVAANVADALTVATVGGDEAIVKRLLDHGADPCADDQHMAQLHLKHPTRPTHTLVEIGTRAKLSATLIARLSCPAIAAAH